VLDGFIWSKDGSLLKALQEVIHYFAEPHHQVFAQD